MTQAVVTSTSGKKASRLPPTSPDLLIDETKPYFLWWTDATVGDLKRHLRAEDPEERAYWLGALLREANSRDVVLFTNGDEIRANWPRLVRYLGRSREMWAWALGLPAPEWPPAEAKAFAAEHRRRFGLPARLEIPEASCEEVDVVHEVVPDISAEQPIVEGIVIESLEDLRANKLTCILSRSEPRDLVDLYFLDRAGYPPEEDLELALRKDAGIDPTILAWLLSKFPVEPLPPMLEELKSAELRKFRESLAARLLSPL